MDARDDDEKRLEAAREAGTELDQFNAELSDTLSGYRAKHLPEGHASNSAHRERQAEKARAQMNALEALLASDPAYAALYNQTFDKLRAAENSTETAIARTLETVSQTGQELADALDKANALPDGWKVFRDPATGSVYDQNGNTVAGDDLAAVVWREGAPTWQEYRDKRQADAEAQARLAALRRFQEELGGYRNRMEDRDNPPKPPEMQEIQNGIETGLAKAQQARPASEFDHTASATASVSLPPPKQ